MGYSQEISVSDPSAFDDGSSGSASGVKRPTVVHEGSSIRIDVDHDIEPSAFVLPLRNGFPFTVDGRTTPVAELRSEQSLRVGHVLWLDGIGLHVVFDTPAPSGAYIVSQGPLSPEQTRPA